MTVTVDDIGRDVTWTEGTTTRTGRLTRCPEPGTPKWWQSNGKAIVLTPDGWAYVRPADLELATPTEVTDAR